MKSVINLVAVLLIIIGIGVFTYEGFSYNKNEEVAKFGNIQITAQTKERVSFSPWFGGICLVGGILLLVVGQFTKK